MDIYGFDELEREILKALDPKEIEKEWNKIGNKVVTDVKLRTPVLTGELRRSIDKEKTKKIGSDYVFELGTNKEYAEPVENGFRTPSGGFKEGVHMFELSIEQLKQELPQELDTWFKAQARRLGL